MRMLGSVTAASPTRLVLPSHPLPEVLAEPHYHTALEHASRRRALLQACHGVVRALQAGLRPSASATGADRAPLPLDLLVGLACFILTADVSMPLADHPEGSLPHPQLLLALAELQALALQLLGSLLAAARRHFLTHAVSVCKALHLLWRRSSLTSPPVFQCSRLRSAIYTLAVSLLSTLGSCIVPLIAQPLATAAAEDLVAVFAPPEADMAAAAAATFEDRACDQAAAGGRQTRRHIRPRRHLLPPPGWSDVQVPIAAANALRALFVAGSELIPIHTASELEVFLIDAVDAISASSMRRASPPASHTTDAALHAALLEALHASVTTGHFHHGATAARSLQLFSRAAARGSIPVRAAARSALHGMDPVLHPTGITAWQAPTPPHPGAPPPSARLRRIPAPTQIPVADATGSAATLPRPAEPPRPATLLHPAAPQPMPSVGGPAPASSLTSQLMTPAPATTGSSNTLAAEDSSAGTGVGGTGVDGMGGVSGGGLGGMGGLGRMGGGLGPMGGGLGGGMMGGGMGGGILPAPSLQHPPTLGPSGATGTAPAQSLTQAESSIITPSSVAPSLAPAPTPPIAIPAALPPAVAAVSRTQAVPAPPKESEGSEGSGSDVEIVDIGPDDEE